jgi:hypothetical protein
MILANIFTHPVVLPYHSLLWLLLPLCLGVAVIYKTIRIDDLRGLPKGILTLSAYMLFGLTALATGLWLIQSYWP